MSDTPSDNNTTAESSIGAQINEMHRQQNLQALEIERPRENQVLHVGDSSEKPKRRLCNKRLVFALSVVAAAALIFGTLTFYFVVIRAKKSSSGSGDAPAPQIYNPKDLPSGLKTQKPDATKQKVILEQETDYIKEYRWKKWKEVNHKTYDNKDSEAARKQLYLQKLRVCDQLSLNEPGSACDYYDEKLAMTEQEISNSYLGFNLTNKNSAVQNETGTYIETVFVNWLNESFVASITPQREVDWGRQLKLEVRNQKCGDCWANAAVTVMEALWQIGGNSYRKFSVQQQIDCGKLKSSDMNGCDGGWSVFSWDYALNTGVVTESQYPYKGSYSWQCPAQQGDRVFPISHFEIFKPATDETSVQKNCDMLKKLVNLGPVAVGIDADMLQIMQGSYVSLKTKASKINHAVVVIGYTQDYWIVQNSWGKGSGEDGIYYFEMGNTLMICEQPEVAFPKVQAKTDTPSAHARVPNEVYYTKGTMNIRSVLLGDMLVMEYLYLTDNRFELDTGFQFRAFSPNYYVQPSAYQVHTGEWVLMLTFVEETETFYFDIEFELNEDFGCFQSANIVNDIIYLAQCTINEDLLQGFCEGQGPETFFLYSSGETPQVLIFELYQPKVADLARRLRARRE